MIQIKLLKLFIEIYRDAKGDGVKTFRQQTWIDTNLNCQGALSGDKATAGDVVLRLSEKDYIKKSVNVRDKRSYSVSLTPKAKELIKDMERMASDVTSKALYGMEDTDIQILNKSLQQIIHNLSKEESLCPEDGKY